MPRTGAKFTQADINRATKVAASVPGFRVRLLLSGEIVIEPGEPALPANDVDMKREIRL